MTETTSPDTCTAHRPRIVAAGEALYLNALKVRDDRASLVRRSDDMWQVQSLSCLVEDVMVIIISTFMVLSDADGDDDGRVNTNRRMMVQ
jgi:hypothetical protein